MYIIITCLAVYFSVWYLQRLIKPRAQEIIRRYVDNLKKFEDGEMCLAHKANVAMAGDVAIAVDKNENNLCLVGGKPGELILNEESLVTKRYNYGDILQTCLLVDGNRINTTSRSSQTGAVLMEEVTASPAATADNDLPPQPFSTGKTRIELELLVNDPDSPIYRLSFLEVPARQKNRPVYLETLKTAEKWHNIISTLIIKADKADEENEKQAQQEREVDGTIHKPYSVADELSKLSELVKEGFITREEFETQKARLL